MKKGDRRIEVQTLPSGELFASEEKVSESVVPEPVRARAAKLFKKDQKVTYERTVVVLYEVAHKSAKGKETEYLVNQAGTAFREVEAGDRQDNDEKKEGKEDEDKREEGQH